MQINNTLFHIFIFIFTLLFTFSVSSSPSPSPALSSHSGSDDLISDMSPSPLPELGSDDSVSDMSPSLAKSDESLRPSSSFSPERSPQKLPENSPAPAVVEASDVPVEEEKSAHKTKESSDGGMSGGKKVGVAFGLIAAACFVGFGGVVYRKRQQNIRRAQYSQAQRLEFF